MKAKILLFLFFLPIASIASDHFELPLGQVMDGKATLTASTDSMIKYWNLALAEQEVNTQILSVYADTIQHRNGVTSWVLKAKTSFSSIRTIIPLILENGTLYVQRFPIDHAKIVTCLGCDSHCAPRMNEISDGLCSAGCDECIKTESLVQLEILHVH